MVRASAGWAIVRFRPSGVTSTLSSDPPGGISIEAASVSRATPSWSWNAAVARPNTTLFSAAISASVCLPGVFSWRGRSARWIVRFARASSLSARPSSLSARPREDQRRTAVPTCGSARIVLRSSESRASNTSSSRRRSRSLEPPNRIARSTSRSIDPTASDGAA